MDTTEGHIQALQREIAEHDAVIAARHAAMSDAKFRLNLLSPVSKLSPETIAYIFTLLKAGTFRNKDLRGYRLAGKLGAWIQVSRVCRLWREIAIDCTSLWRDLPLLSSSGVAAFLERSRGASLDITIFHEKEGHHYRDTIAEMLHALRGHGARINKLYIDAPVGEFIGSYVLEMLVMHCCESLCLRGPQTSKVIDIPDLMLRCAVELREVDLERCSFDCTLLTHYNLRVLSLRTVNEVIPIGLEELMCSIKCMSQLESLTLFNSFSAADGLTIQPVNLPSLKSLEVDNRVSYVNALLRSLTLPANVQVTLTARAPGLEPENVPSLLSTITDSFSDSISKYQTLFIDEGNLDGGMVTVAYSLYPETFKTDSPESPENYVKPCPFRLTISFLPPHMNRSVFTHFFKAQLPLDQVTQVRLTRSQILPIMTAKTLSMTVGRLPNLVSVAFLCVPMQYDMDSHEIDLNVFDVDLLERVIVQRWKDGAQLETLFIKSYAMSMMHDYLARMKTVVERFVNDPEDEHAVRKRIREEINKHNNRDAIDRIPEITT